MVLYGIAWYLVVRFPNPLALPRASESENLTRSRVEFRVKSDAGGDNSVGCWLLSVGEMLDDDQVVVEK